MSGIVSTLQLIDMHQIKFHEDHEHVRLDHLCKSIEEEGTLRNPPLAIRMKDPSQFLIIDGAHRCNALMKLACKRIVVQEIALTDLQLQFWNHVVSDDSWLQQLRQDSRLRWESQLLAEQPIATLLEADGNFSYLYAQTPNPDVQERIRASHWLVETYSKQLPVRRIPQDTDFFPKSGEVFIEFSPVLIQDVIRIVEQGHVMPAGMTRFIVHGRLLNLRIPLSLLTSERIDVDQFQELQQTWSGSLRFYSDAVYIYES